MKTALDILLENEEAKLLGSSIDSGEICTYDVELVEKCMNQYADQFKPKWINMNDRLPEMDKLVLLHSKNYSHLPIVIGKRIQYGSGDIWDVADDYKGIVGYTHWMPLPKPPSV